MLHILLTILKILGILILVILGLILSVILVVLFVPIRYQGDVLFDGKPKAEAMVSWLLRVIRVHVNYGEDGLTILAKVLWFKIFEQTPDEPKELSDTEASEKVTSQISEKTNVPASEAPVKSEKSSVPVSETPLKTEKSNKTVSVAVSERKMPESPKTFSEENAKESHKEIHKEIHKETSQPKNSAVDKIGTVVTNVIQKIRSIYLSLTGKYEAGKEKIDMVRSFLENEKNRQTIRLIWKRVLKIIKHCLPRKMNGRVKFGFDDPATTGQILTYISPFYGVYAKTVSIEPVFDEKVMEGELHLKGRIRLAVLLWGAIRVLLNKNFRILLKKLLKRNK